MQRIVPELPLRHNVCQALLGSPVHERCLLDWIECHENNDVKACGAIAARYGLDQRRLMQLYVDALVWGAADPGFTA
jgi:c-di-GMP-related signal transduction protein